MENSKQLANRLQEVLLDGHWIANTNYWELISDISIEEATTTLGKHNSIALLIFHVNYYLDGLLHAFNTGRLEIRDAFSFDMPSLESEDQWQSLKETFHSNAQKFVKAVEDFSQDTLEGPFIEEQYGNYRRNIEGVIEHSYYHMGQIALIKKLLRVRS